MRRGKRPRSSSPNTHVRSRRSPAPRRQTPSPRPDVGAGLPPRLMLHGVSAERLSIAQVTPHRRGTRNAVNDYVTNVAEELGRRGHEVVLLGSGDGVKKRLAAGEFDIVH